MADTPSRASSADRPRSSSPSSQAGPSTPRHHQHPSHSVPEAEETDPTESETIQRHLDRRRKSSLIHGKKPSLPHLRGKNSSQTLMRDAAWYEQMNEVDELEQDDDGPEGVGRSVTFDMEELRRNLPEAVKLFQDKEEYHGVDLDKDLERGYAWDVMFENQRGIHILGKAYFAANSLLPSDPSPYTLPSHPLPSASTLVVSTEGPDRTDKRIKPSPPWARPKSRAQAADNRDFHQGKHRIHLGSSSRDIKTDYSPSSFQCPGPQWEWVTPWMINMKVGTDEGGWRYNAWFRNKGWRNHAGPAGWWGWVRRREWVRLRMVRRIEGEEEEDNKGQKHEVGKGPRRQKLVQVLQEDKEDGAGAILRQMGGIKLDREKLEWWEEGLKNIVDDSDARGDLEQILRDIDNIKELHRAFTYRSNFTAFLALLESHHYTVASLPSSPFPSLPSSPKQP